MIYVMITGTEEQADRSVCLVQAKSKIDAAKMVGLENDSTFWASFTDEQVSAILNAKEGYIAKDM